MIEFVKRVGEKRYNARLHILSHFPTSLKSQYCRRTNMLDSVFHMIF